MTSDVRAAPLHRDYMIRAIFIIFAALLSFSMNASAQSGCSGIRLSKSNYFKTQGATCGKVKGKWIAGGISRGFFTPSTCTIDALKKKVSRTSKPQLKKSLATKLKTLQTKYSKDRKVCKAGRPLPTPTSSGSIQLNRDASTIIFDNSFDVLRAVANGGAVKGSSLRMLSDDADVPGRKGGRAKVSGAFTGNDRNGVIDFEGFLNRLGFPMFESGTILYDLVLESSSITGTLSATNLRIVIQGVVRKVSFNATYNLALEGGLWKGGAQGTVSVDDQEESFNIDYDTPILLAIEAIPLNKKGEEVPGTTVDAGNKVRVRLWANSNSPVNWVNSRWESPSKNLEGGGSSQRYCRYGKCSDLPSEWTFAEGDIGYWIWYRDYPISTFQEPGEYSWEMSVKNAAELTSRSLTATIEVRNSSYTAEKPKIVGIRLATSGISSGTGATSTVTILAQSTSPVSWLNRSFQGPSGNIYGGGSSFSFESCAAYLDSVGHICRGRDAEHYFTSFTDTISRWAPNGRYSYDTISVENAAKLTSVDYDGDLSFIVENNLTANTPEIVSIDVVSYIQGQDPLISGTPLNGICLVAGAVSDPFLMAVIITATSNAPVNWINASFYGPLGNLMGGGFGASFTEVSPGVWRYAMLSSLQSPMHAPKGTYYWQDISVKNEGAKSSTAYGGGLSFQLKTSCS